MATGRTADADASVSTGPAATACTAPCVVAAEYARSTTCTVDAAVGPTTSATFGTETGWAGGPKGVGVAPGSPFSSGCSAPDAVAGSPALPRDQPPAGSTRSWAGDDDCDAPAATVAAARSAPAFDDVSGRLKYAAAGDGAGMCPTELRHIGGLASRDDAAKATPVGAGSSRGARALSGAPSSRGARAPYRTVEVWPSGGAPTTLCSSSDVSADAGADAGARDAAVGVLTTGAATGAGAGGTVVAAACAGAGSVAVGAKTTGAGAAGMVVGAKTTGAAGGAAAGV